MIKGGTTGGPSAKATATLVRGRSYPRAIPIKQQAAPPEITGTLTEPSLIINRPKSCIGVATQCPDLGNSTDGKCLIGGYVYRGNALPKLAGRYILGDCTTGAIRATTDERAHGPIEQLFTSPFIEVVTFGQDRDGELYIAGTTGQVYRIAPSGPPIGDPPALLSQLGVFASAQLDARAWCHSLRCEHAALVRRGKEARWMSCPPTPNSKSTSRRTAAGAFRWVRCSSNISS